MEINEKFTILIGTCDMYEFLWNDFAKLFNMYWDHRLDVKKFFVSETKSADIEGFEFLTPGFLPYSDCLMRSLNSIDTPYVLWLQDDYFLQKKIYKEKFEKYFEMIEYYSIDRFCPNRNRSYIRYYTLDNIEENYFRMDQNSNYTISMQASIWNVDFFKQCLPIDNSENPWEFEINGSARLNRLKNHKIIYEVASDDWYLEAMNKGKMTEDYHRIKKNL